MNRREVVLAAMAAGGQGVAFDPLRILHLLFLVDREIPDLVDGPHFQFDGYYFGPYDSDVFDELEQLKRDSQVKIEGPDSDGRKRYSLTSEGHDAGAALLGQVTAEGQRFIEDAVRWLRLSTLKRILASLAKRYPGMAAEIVVTVSPSRPRAADPSRLSPFLRGVASLADFTGSLRESRPAEPEESFEARVARSIWEDWASVGADLEDAMAYFAPPEPVR